MSRLPHRFTLGALFLLGLTFSLHAEILVKSGEKIVFLGDSITQAGWTNPLGYVRLVMAGLAANGVNAEAIPAGISGQKSNQMLARVDALLQQKPQWLTLSCGVNDVWHGLGGVPLDDAQAAAATYKMEKKDEPAKGTYEKNIAAILERAKAAGAKPVLFTSTPIGEDPAKPENAKLAPYNDFLRRFAEEQKIPLVDLNQIFQKQIKEENQPTAKVLTVDGVHMNGKGNRLMATSILETFGLDAGQLQNATEAWDKIPVPATPAPKATPAATPQP